MANNEPRPQYSLTNFFVFMFVAAIFAFLMAKFEVKNIGPWAIFAFIVFLLHLALTWVARSATAAAANDPSSPTVVDSFKDDYDASIVVGRLRTEGINAVAVGGYTSGFQVEAPGYVDVVVPQSELAQAKEILAKPESRKRD
jgi:hypothetical protein